MHKYGPAITYFDRTMGNYDAGKDEDARIRKGYAYFLMKKFDLAAREFQIYLNNYPRGRYSDTAQKWKSMSTQEMLYRIQNRMIPDEEEGESPEEGRKDGSGDGTSSQDTSNKPMTGRPGSAQFEDAEYENVGEL